MKVALSCLLLLAFPAAAADPGAEPAEGQHPRPAVAEQGYAYQLFVPRGYRRSGEGRWPLLIFLHGSGERGADIERVKVHGPPRLVADRPDFPFILVSPQLPAEEDWDLAKLRAILDHLESRLRVDPARVYLTGLSRGAHASWRWAAAEPARFAAVVPVAGRGDPSQACKLKDTPVWAFHGDRDNVVTPFGSFAMVEAIRSCGGTPRLTIYPDRGHDAWNPAYADPALYQWLLGHSLERPGGTEGEADDP